MNAGPARSVLGCVRRAGRRGLGLLLLLTGTVAAVAADEVLRIGIEGLGPPFSYRDERGELKGYTVEMCEAIGRDQGFRIQWVLKSWAELIEDFRAGRLDLLGNAGRTPEREKYMDFSATTVEMNGAIFVRAGDRSILRRADLAGKRVGAVAQGLAWEYFRQHYPEAILLPLRDRHDLVDALLSGRCDAIVGIDVITNFGLRRTGKAQLVEVSPVRLDGLDFNMHMAVPKGRRDLLARLNAGLINLARRDQEEPLYEKWIGPLRPQPTSWQQIRPLVLTLAGLGALVLAGVWFLAVQRRHLRVFRAQAEMLRRSESQLQTIMHAVPALIFYLDEERRCRSVNRTFEVWTGQSRQDCFGRKLIEFVIPAEHARIERAFTRVFRGETIRGEGPLTLPTGVTKWIQASYIPDLAPDGRVLGCTIVGVDLTASRLAQSELALQAAALQAAADPIVITDASARIEWANDAFTALTGYTLDEARGRTAGELLASHRQSREFYRELWETVLAGRVWCGELINRRKDHSTYSERLTITPIRDEHGAISHFIALKQDITQRRLLEEQLLFSQRQESLGRLASGIAHDLNNILTPVLLMPPMLREFTTDPEAQQLIEVIGSSAQRGGALLRKLLIYGRGAEIRHELTSLAQVVEGMTHLIHETFPRNITLALRLAPGLPLVSADATQLHQVLMNLCMNAADAMPHGGQLTLSLEAAEIDDRLATERRVTPGPYQVLGVADTGRGIAPEVQVRMFDPFFTTKPHGEGTGLGLSTVQGIVRSHHGFIHVLSAPGRGSTFRVHLPAGP